MTIVGELLARHHERLSGFPAPLEQHYEAGLRALYRRGFRPTSCKAGQKPGWN
ncbi:MAG: hypothetical protein IPI85_07405 [Dehalococcoidia bacterium]|nr:hypothetical protein [Dehalococcoidia bacterium]